MPLSESVCCVAVTLKMTAWVQQWICIKFCIKLEHSPMETIQMIHKAAAMGNWWLAASSQQRARSCITSHAEIWQNIKSPRWLSLPTAQICNFWLFPKLKSPLKGKKFQSIDEIQENTTGELMATGRTVWGPNVSTLKGTEVPLSCVQCFLSYIFFNKYLYFSYYMAGYFLARPHTLLGREGSYKCPWLS